MPKNQHTQVVPENPKPQQEGCLSVLVRLSWLMAGNVIIFFLCLKIFQKNGFSILDAAFWVTVAAMVLVRYIDITRFNGQTSDNQPATLAHWRKYILLLLAVSAAMWVLAHALAYLF